MSEGDLDIKLYGDASHVIKEQAKLIKQQEQALEAYKKLGTESKKAGKEAEKAAKEAEKANAAAAKELDRFARATKDINRTPLEKYADEMLRLNRALKAGKIDQETFNRAVGQAKSEFQKAGVAQQGAFGSSALGNLVSYAAGMVSVAAAIGLVTKAIAAKREEENRLGDKQFLESASLGSLAQLPEMTPQAMDRLVNEAKSTFAEGGAMTLPDAVELQKVLESGNIGQWRADFSRMQASGLAQAIPMAEAGIKMKAGFGEKEVGDFHSMMSKAFGAAKLGLGEADQILTATAKVSQQAGRLGLSDEETAAAISTASAVVGPDEAATQVEQLLVGIEKEGIGLGFLKPGKTLTEQVARLSQLENEGNDIREMLGGRQEAIKGFGMLASPQGKAAMQANMQNIVQAEKEDWFGKRMELAEGIPENIGAIAKRQSANRAELAGGRAGTIENIADAVADDLVTLQRQRNGEFMATLQRGQNVVDRLFGNETFIRDNAATATPETQQKAEQLGLIIDRVGETLDRAASNLERASQTNHTNAARANQAAAGGAVEAR